MSYIDEMMRSGQNIMDAVNDAIITKDYGSLNKNIKIQVIDLTNEIDRYNQQMRREMYYRQQQNRRQMAAAQAAQQGMYQRQIAAAKGTPFQRLRPSYGNSTMKMILGSFGIFFFLTALFGAFLSFAVDVAVVSVVGIVVCAILFKSGISGRKLIDKFYQYSRLCGKEDYISIAKLAKVAGESEESLVSNIEAMIKKGYLPHAKMDANKKTLMLSDQVYEEYLKREEAKISQAEAAAAKAKAEADKEAGIENLNVSEEVKKTIREGQKFIEYIKVSNDKIADPEMTKKLNKLQNVVEMIFAQVRKDPSSAGDLNKLMTYYLPTTQKLIDSYIELGNQKMYSKNIEDTKKEIEGAIDTVNDAFSNLFDSLFQDVAWDISSEVSAMKSMMAQDGLADPAINNMRQSIQQDATEMYKEMQASSVAETAEQVSAKPQDVSTVGKPELVFDDVQTDEGTLRQTH